MLARGYPGGTDFSGGQWQRVALARALCAVRQGAGVVLLDEPTAQLDVRGEAEIFDRILAATRHTTTILISHRFSTVRHADRICVLERGQVVELGTHDELMAAGGRYRTMFELQASRFGDDDARKERTSMSSTDDLPPALPAMWRALKRGYEAEPLALERVVRAVAAGRAAGRAARALAQAARRRRARRPARAGADRGRRAGRVGGRDLVPARDQRPHPAPVPRPGDDRARVARGPAAGVGGHDRAPRTPRVSRSAGGAARPGVRARPHVHVAVLDVRVDPAAGRDAGAADVDPPGAGAAGRVCAADGADVDLAAGRGARGRRARRGGQSAGAAPLRPGHDRPARQGGAGDAASAIAWWPTRRAAWERWYRPVAAARCGKRHVAHAGVGDLRRRVRRRRGVRVVGSEGNGPGDVLLVLAAGSRLSAYIGATVGEIGFLRGIWLDGSRRLAWLEDYVARAGCETPIVPCPKRLEQGIRFEHVSFAYPGTDRLVLDDVNLQLEPGSVVAIVGENGAGKTTLVKLLCRLYQPTSGRILVDGEELARHAAGSRGDRACRVRFRISSGSSSRRATPWASATCRAWTTSRAVAAAVDRAGAGDVSSSSPPGSRRSSARPGPRAWSSASASGRSSRCAGIHARSPAAPGARRADGGARRRDRARPVRALRGRGARRPQRASTQPTPDGRITILVSHRFSTVRMADFIVVLDGARVVESGTHDELLAKGGQYAELYTIQAAAYR